MQMVGPVTQILIGLRRFLLLTHNYILWFGMSYAMLPVSPFLTDFHKISVDFRPFHHHQLEGIRLHAPHHDGMVTVLAGAVPEALVPRLLLRAVEDDEVALIDAAH